MVSQLFKNFSCKFFTVSTGSRQWIPSWTRGVHTTISTWSISLDRYYTHPCVGLPGDLRVFRLKFLCAFLLAPVRASCHIHLILFCLGHWRTILSINLNYYNTEESYILKLLCAPVSVDKLQKFLLFSAVYLLDREPLTAWPAHGNDDSQPYPIPNLNLGPNLRCHVQQGPRCYPVCEYDSDTVYGSNVGGGHL
jgi:hypothetical protein